MLTDRPGTLSADFFANILDMDIEWTPIDGAERVFDGCDRASGAKKWSASRVDLVFGRIRSFGRWPRSMPGGTTPGSLSVILSPPGPR